MFLRRRDSVRVIKRYSGTIRKVNTIRGLHPSILFLSVRVPHVDNLRVIKVLSPRRHPCVIFLATFSRCTVGTFRRRTFSCLLGPVSRTQLRGALTQLHRRHDGRSISLLPRGRRTLGFVPYAKRDQVCLLRVGSITFIDDQVDNICIADRRKGRNFARLALHALRDHAPLLHYRHRCLIGLTRLRRVHLRSGNRTRLVLHGNLAIPIDHHCLGDLGRTVNLWGATGVTFYLVGA